MSQRILIGVVIGSGVLLSAGGLFGAKVTKPEGTTLNPGDALQPSGGQSVRVDDAQWHPSNADLKFKAMVFPQRTRLTGDPAPAEATFEATSGSASHIALTHGWAYVRAFNEGTMTSPVQQSGTSEDMELQKTILNPYPISTVKAVEAGAEGTDFLLMVLPIPHTPDAIVLVMHMGSETGGDVWARLKLGTPPYDTKWIPYVDRDDLFIAVKVSDFEGTPTYNWIKVLDYEGNPEDTKAERRISRRAKKIHDRIEKFRDDAPEVFWNPGVIGEMETQ